VSAAAALSGRQWTKNFTAKAFSADSELQSVATRNVVFLDQKDLEAFQVRCCSFKESK